MVPEISEFSYGFALTNELAALMDVQFAPVFPSLLEEGKPGGGYDVKLEAPGVPLYLQFKRSDCMRMRSVREIRTHRLPLEMPFYRFKITERRRSLQHDLLLELERTTGLVFYAAPRFHMLSEINRSWQDKRVASDSVFVRPSRIGALDDDLHHVAFDSNQTFVCSEPKQVFHESIHDIIGTLKERLDIEARPLRDVVKEQVTGTRAVADRVRERRATSATPSEREVMNIIDRAPRRPTESPPALRAGTPAGEAERDLLELADNALRLFNAQVVVAQRREGG